MTYLLVDKPKKVVGFGGFDKRRDRTGSATLGETKFEEAELFGRDAAESQDYVKDGQGQSKSAQGRKTKPRSGKSGG